MLTSMKAIKFCVYKEPPFYVAQCLNVEVSSFGDSMEQAITNLKEAVELYFEDAPAGDYHQIDEVLVGEGVVNG